jgi:hypothetical protein
MGDIRADPRPRVPSRTHPGAGMGAAAAAAAVIIAVAAGMLYMHSRSALRSTGAPSTPSASASTPPGPSAGGQAGAELQHLRILPTRPHIAGYQRDCGDGRACSFGDGWAAIPGGDAECNTRDLVLARQLTHIAYATGSTCNIVAGTLHDPYTGQTVLLTKADPEAVQVDHVFPLAAAYDLGAANWPQAERDAFAQDLTELTAASGNANDDKGDSTPGEWMPSNYADRCQYAARYIAVADKYQLAITTADQAALSAALATC